MSWQKAQVAEMGFWSSLWTSDHSLADSETRKQEFIIKQLEDAFTFQLENELHDLKVLDVGCGPVSWLSRHTTGTIAHGVDPIRYPEWVEDGYHKAGLILFTCPVETYQAGPYDAILLYNCLQHVENLQTVVAKCNDLLKPGGRIYVAENLEVPRNEAHLHYLTTDLLDRLFAKCGFVGAAVTRNAHLPGLCETPQGWPLKLYLGVFQKHSQPKKAGKFRLHVLGLAHTKTTREYMPCFSDDTDILTVDGWQSLAQYVNSISRVEVPTLNLTTGKVENQKPITYHAHDYDGPMFHQHGASIDIMVTPDHHLLLRTEADIRGNRSFRFLTPEKAPQHVQYRRDFPWQDGPDQATFTLPEYHARNVKPRAKRELLMDDFLPLLGIYLAEGCTGATPYSTTGEEARVHAHHSICIAQEKESGRMAIKTWLSKLPFTVHETPKSFLIHDVQLATWFRTFGKSRDKFIPHDFKNLSKRQLRILLEAMMIGDGWEAKTCRRYVSYSKRLADDISEIALKLGYAVTTFSGETPTGTRYIVTMSERHKLCRVNVSEDNRSEVNYTGKVYCLTVENGTLYVRRNGKSAWQGNCAYTQKVLKMCQMMSDLGHTVYHYGSEGSEPACSEHITVISNAKQKEVYGDYDWRSEFFKHDGKDAAYLHFDDNAIREMKHRWNTRDLLLISMGNYQYPIAAALNEWDATIEMGIGYSGVFSRRRVFESYAWMHYIYGLLQKRGPGEAACQPSWYDAVIPNYFDPADFTFSDRKQDYFLYMGRLIPLKGVHIAAQCCERIGAKLIVAGQGKLSDLDIKGPHVEHVGTVGAEERSRLMSNAQAIFVPTMYLGPFEGVAVEAMFCGTPAITTDWGVFNETVNHGVSGWRCRTMDDFVWAANHAGDLDPFKIREWAVSNYSMKRVAPMYEEYFTKCLDVWGDGWYAQHPERTQLDWLRRA